MTGTAVALVGRMERVSEYATELETIARRRWRHATDLLLVITILLVGFEALQGGYRPMPFRIASMAAQVLAVATTMIVARWATVREPLTARRVGR